MKIMIHLYAYMQTSHSGMWKPMLKYIDTMRFYTKDPKTANDKLKQ